MGKSHVRLQVGFMTAEVVVVVGGHSGMEENIAREMET